MSRINAKLRKNEEGIMHWCPGCDMIHMIPLPRWKWDGDVDAPSVNPSVNYVGICHYTLSKGRLIFAADSRHALAGQTVDLPDIPAEDNPP